MCLPLICDNSVAEQVARSSKFAFLTFIGSARVGWHLKSILAPGVRFALEHGGSAPVIVDRDADLDDALPLLLRGAFYHSGQVCVSTQRIFVHDDVLIDFEKRFVESVRRLKAGDPRNADTDCGPLIRTQDVNRIEEWVQSAADRGAEILCGGSRMGDSCFNPTVLRHVPSDDRLMHEEVFGPVALIQPFHDLDQAISKSNDVSWSFQAAYFGRDLHRAMAAAKALKASAVMINDSTSFRVDWMPFRGNGPSGFGTGGIPFTMRDMINEKLIVLRDSNFKF
jgi:acyl-CoA reductase-like NAD-dependent aldehyde dehydrogenase